MENRQRTYPRWRFKAITPTVVVMANDLPTRLCEECGQIWSSGSFLDPTIKADCGFCGASLVHRRRLPDALADELEQLSAANGVSATNGAGAPVA